MQVQSCALRAHGELGPGWQQQRQRIEATLSQSQLPARLEALARFDGVSSAWVDKRTAPLPLPINEVLAELASVAESAHHILELLNREHLRRDELAGLAKQAANRAEHVAHGLQQGRGGVR